MALQRHRSQKSSQDARLFAPASSRIRRFEFADLFTKDERRHILRTVRGGVPRNAAILRCAFFADLPSEPGWSLILWHGSSPAADLKGCEAGDVSKEERCRSEPRCSSASASAWQPQKSEKENKTVAKTEESPERRRGHRAPLQSEVKKGRDAEEVPEEERSSSDYRRGRHVPLECKMGFDTGVWTEEEDSRSESRRGRRVPSKGKKKAAEDSRSGSTKPKMKKQGKKNKRRDAEADVEPPSRTGRRRRR